MKKIYFYSNEKHTHHQTILSTLNNAIDLMQSKFFSNRFQTLTDKIQGETILIALGKNAWVHANNYIQKLPVIFKSAFIFQAESYIDKLPSPKSNINLFLMSHPLPNKNNIDATRSLIKYLHHQHDLGSIVFIVTGGASSCFTIPEQQLDEDIFLKLMKHIYEAGLSITLMNQIRSVIDGVKAGKFLSLFPQSQILSLIFSDVIDDDPRIIGSGPSIGGMPLDPQAEQWLFDTAKKLNITQEITRLINKYKNHIEQQEIKENNRIIITRFDFLNYLVEGLKKIKSTIIIESNNLVSNVFFVCDQIRSKLENSQTISSIIIWMGEPLVTLPANNESQNKGGRISHLLTILASQWILPDNITLYGFATDGKDGSSHFAGYYIDSSICNQIQSHPQLSQFLSNANTGLLFEQLGCVFSNESTNINFMDLFIAVID